ncbi:hypothetical protein RQP46_000987 [Phenoliferia psychrophenolica]
MGITLNDIIRYAKKAFKFWKKYQKEHPSGQQGGGGQQQGGQQGGGGGAWQGQQGQQGQSPYPAPNQQSNQGAWNNNQQQHGGQQQQQQQPQAGGYGSHDGPATNQDMANAQNSEYVNLRNQAIREGDLMGKAFSDSKAAYSGGDGARAKQLSGEGHDHQRRKDDFNLQAATWIYNENNKRQPPGTIDLHGLYVAESVSFTEKAITASRQQGMSELRVIVGKGNHSQSHVAKVKPAIEDLMQRQNITAALDPHNSGVLVIQLAGGQGGRGSREVMGDLEKDPNVCVVM